MFFVALWQHFSELFTRIPFLRMVFILNIILGRSFCWHKVLQIRKLELWLIAWYVSTESWRSRYVFQCYKIPGYILFLSKLSQHSTEFWFWWVWISRLDNFRRPISLKKSHQSLGLTQSGSRFTKPSSYLYHITLHFSNRLLQDHFDLEAIQSWLLQFYFFLFRFPSLHQPVSVI